MASCRKRILKEKELMRLELEEGAKELIDAEVKTHPDIESMDGIWEEMYKEDLDAGLFDEWPEESTYDDHYDDYYYDDYYYEDYYDSSDNETARPGQHVRCRSTGETFIMTEDGRFVNLQNGGYKMIWNYEVIYG
jgi:hypothetical protein